MLKKYGAVGNKIKEKSEGYYGVKSEWGEAAVASNPGAIFIAVHKVLA